MKNLIAAFLLFFACTTIQAQIGGNTAPHAVSPATATVVDATITVGGTVNLTNATVQISNNYYAGDVLSYNSTVATSFGITGSYSTASGVSGILSFTGTTTPANWQALLRTVSYQNTAASCGPSSRTIVFNQGNYLFNSYSQHYYQYVNTSLNWVAAKAAAAAMSYNGMQGYLATITSAGENNFVWKLLAADAWIGGSDEMGLINAATGATTFTTQAAANGNEYWVTGPEAGTKFSTGLSSPVAPTGVYMNWNAGEPNNAGNEYYTEFYSSGAQGGKWNDLGIGNTLPYVVEYGGLPSDLPQNNSLTETLTITSTVGGDITGGNVSVCAGTNSTTLTSTAAVSGVTIVRWESSLDNFLTAGTPIASTSATYTATNLTQTTYFRSIANGNSCSTSPSSVTKITVGNSVAGTISADNTTVCNGSAANLSLAGNVGNVLKWQSSPDNATWTDIANTTALYTTPALATGTYYYRAQVQNTGCTAIATTNAITITATSGSSSVGGTLSGASLCPSPNAATLTLSGYTGVIQKWQYSTNGGATWTDISNTAATYAVSNLAVTTLYRVSVKNGSCNAVNSTTGTVTVNALPVVAAITGTASTCAGSTTTLADATTGGVWTSANTGVATVDASGVVTGVAAGTSAITYTVTNGGGCSTAVTQTVTVNALPTVAAITGTASVCAGSTTTLADATTAGVWTSGTTSVATVSATGVVTGVSAGTSVITYTVTNGSGCATAVTKTVTVNAVPTVAVITGTASVCAGSNTTLADATTGGVWTSGTSSVATVDASGAVTGVAAGTSLITYTVTNGSGCTSAVTQSVTVNALPVVAAITGTASVCAGSTTTLADATSGGVWTSGTTSVATVSATGVVAGVSAGTSVITYTITNGSGCVTAVTKTVTVNALPTVAAITGTASVCAGSTTTLADATSGGVWTSGTTSVATVSATGVVTGVSAGTSLITYTITNGSGCVTAVTQTVTVNALPVVAAVTGTASVCAGSTTTLADATSGGAWTSGTTSVATVNASGVVTGVAAGTSVITYTVTNGSGCVTAVTKTVTVNALPTVASITGTASVCAGSTTTLADATSGGAWTSGTTSVATVNASGVVTGVAAGTSVITYTVTNGSGCVTAVTKTVTVNALPTVASITGTASVCIGSITTLADATAGGTWFSSNTLAATVDVNGAVTGVAAGTTTVSYTIFNGAGCASVATQLVTVNSLPVVPAITGTASVCIGSTTTFANSTTGGSWTSGTSSVATVDASGVITGVAAGTSVITYTVNNGSGCTTAVTKTVTVNALPIVAAITGTASVCAGSTTTLADASSGGVWTSGTTSVATVSASGVVTGVADGTSVISYAVTNGNGCATTVTQTVTVNALPVIPAITGTPAVCTGLTTTLSNAMPDGVWYSSNTLAATIDANGVVTGVANGTADITYTVTNGNGCTNVATLTITVNNIPTIAAITGTAGVCVGLTTTLADATAGGTWTSNNTAVATVDANGVVTAVSAGSAVITYTVTNGSGCTAFVTQTVTVNDLPVVPAITGAANICTGSTSALSNTVSDGVWFSSNTLAATVDADGLVTGVAAGTANITYTVTNGTGCTTVATLTVTVKDKVTVSAITGTSTVCAGSTTTLADATAAGVWSSATPSVATVDASGVVTGVSAGTSVISYTVDNGIGCSTAVTQTVTVSAVPTVPAISSNGTDVSLGFTIALSNSTPAGVWSSDDAGIVSVDAQGVATGVALGSATITYTVTNGGGCTQSATIVLTTVPYTHTDAPLVTDSVYFISDPMNPATPIDQITPAPGASLTFYSSATGGSSSATAPALPTQPGTVTYWVSQTVNGVESDRVAFKVTMVTPDVFVPKVFTPNNDGINDIIKPIIPGLKEFRFFKIYNRWGNLVYSSTDPNQGWDGRFKGTPQPRESYLWMIEGVDRNGQVKKYSGMITLFR